jgi:nucleotide-binding universal stress UspA family protein
MNPIETSFLSPLAVDCPERVLVSYEASADGRAAHSHALGIAHPAGAALLVVAVVPHEATNVGCARCRWNAAMWNRELDAIAQEELGEAARLVGKPYAVEYDVARGPLATAIADAASRFRADLIVLPWRRSGRLRRLFSGDLVERVSRERAWRVVVAPTATRGRHRHTSKPDVGARSTKVSRLVAY